MGGGGGGGRAPALCGRLSLLEAIVISDWSLRTKNCLLDYKDQGYFLWNHLFFQTSTDLDSVLCTGS